MLYLGLIGSCSVLRRLRVSASGGSNVQGKRIQLGASLIGCARAGRELEFGLYSGPRQCG